MDGVRTIGSWLLVSGLVSGVIFWLVYAVFFPSPKLVRLSPADKKRLLWQAFSADLGGLMKEGLKGQFIAYYIRDGRVLAWHTCPNFEELFEACQQNLPVMLYELLIVQIDQVDWLEEPLSPSEIGALRMMGDLGEAENLDEFVEREDRETIGERETTPQPSALSFIKVNGLSAMDVEQLCGEEKSALPGTSLRETPTYESPC